MCKWFIKKVLPGETSKESREAGQGEKEAKHKGKISGKVWQNVPSTWHCRVLRSVFYLRVGLSQTAGFSCSWTGQSEPE